MEVILAYNKPNHKLPKPQRVTTTQATPLKLHKVNCQQLFLGCF